MPIVQAEANRLLDASFGTAAYVAPTTPMKLALTTTVPTATTAGTKVTGGSYADQTLTMAAATSGANAISGSVSYTGMPATTVQGVDVYDAAARRAWGGALSASKTTNSGDTFTVNSLTAAIS